MPIHFSDPDVVSEIEGVNSALIVPCTLCPAVTAAVREKKPFIHLFRSLLKSPPFERYIKALQSRLADKEVRTEVFKSHLYHHIGSCACGRRPAVRSFVNVLAGTTP